MSEVPSGISFTPGLPRVLDIQESQAAQAGEAAQAAEAAQATSLKIHENQWKSLKIIENH